MTNQLILSIQSAVIHGAVGNSAAMPIYQHLQQPAECLDTVRLAAHPGFGTTALSITPALEMAGLLADYARLDAFDRLGGVQTGYFGDHSQIEPVARFLATATDKNAALIYLLDPVLGDEGRLYVDKAIFDLIRAFLLPRADIITPNQFELGLLTGTVIRNESDAITAARRLVKGRLKAVFVTGVTACQTRSGTGQISDILVSPEATEIITADKRPRGISGSGDVLSAFFFHAILSGQSLAQAARTASADTGKIIARADTALTMPVFSHIWENTKAR